MELYHYLECGLDYIYLVNDWTVGDADFDNGQVMDAATRRILEADALHHEIARTIILSPRNLQGRDLLFLRQQLNLSMTEYCGMTGVPRFKLFEWEGSSKPVPRYADTCAKLIYAAGCGDGDLGQRIVRMLRDERPVDEAATPHMIAFERSSGAWRVAERWPPQISLGDTKES